MSCAVIDLYPRRATMVGVKYANELRTIVFESFRIISIGPLKVVKARVLSYTHIGKIMSNHTRSEACLENLSSTGTFSREAARLCFKLSRNTCLFVIAQPLSHCRPVWQAENHERNTDNGDETLDDEKPAEPLEAGITIHEADTVPNAPSKSPCKRCGGKNESNAG